MGKAFNCPASQYLTAIMGFFLKIYIQTSKFSLALQSEVFLSGFFKPTVCMHVSKFAQV